MIASDDLQGAMVLVGISRQEVDGAWSQEQYAGRADIKKHDDFDLVTLACSDGAERSFPFDPRSLQKAGPGEYKLRSTGETVTDPDFLMTWEVTKEEKQ